MRKLPWILLLSLSALRPAMAFTCNASVVKNDCWIPYDVTVNVLDGETEKSLATIVIPKGTTYATVQYVCVPQQTLKFTATFLPAIWESDIGKVYKSKSYLELPDKVDPKAKDWSITLCFSDDFIGLPLPPSSAGNCKCNRNIVPKAA